MKTAAFVLCALLLTTCPVFAGGISGGGGGAGGTAASQFGPDQASLKDEFPNGNITSGTIGQLGWQVTNIGSAPVVGRAPALANHPGIVTFATNATPAVNAGGSLTVGASSGSAFVTGLGNTAGWDSYWVWKLEQTTDTRLAAGFNGDFSTSNPLPANGIYIQYDTHPSVLLSNTTYHFICKIQIGSFKTIETVGNAGAVRATNVVTLKTTSAHGYAVGNVVAVSGVTDASFNGLYTIASTPLTTTLTFAQTGADVTSGGGQVAASTMTDVNSTVPADTNFHTFRIRSLVAGTILFSIDGGAESAISTNCPTINQLPDFYLVTDSTVQKIIDLDYFAFWMNGLLR
jgi:hypothetical protein